ncbi:hypothetical protein BR93DRAFT_86382 [Coniochaeta sp. PMI_546]|nr:hypothetical protein BR93DRAFT_86382 [Coniochaeta sp. PMI_546]
MRTLDPIRHLQSAQTGTVVIRAEPRHHFLCLLLSDIQNTCRQRQERFLLPITIVKPYFFCSSPAIFNSRHVQSVVVRNTHSRSQSSTYYTLTPRISSASHQTTHFKQWHTSTTTPQPTPAPRLRNRRRKPTTTIKAPPATQTSNRTRNREDTIPPSSRRATTRMTEGVGQGLWRLVWPVWLAAAAWIVCFSKKRWNDTGIKGRRSKRTRSQCDPSLGSDGYRWRRVVELCSARDECAGAAHGHA